MDCTGLMDGRKDTPSLGVEEDGRISVSARKMVKLEENQEIGDNHRNKQV